MVNFCAKFFVVLISYFSIQLVETLGSSRQSCSREPGEFSVRKRPGDNGYRIGIAGHPTFYVPGQEYLVTLSSTPPARFREFTFASLLVSDDTIPAGNFEIMDHELTQVVPNCPHVLMQASKVSKTSMTFRWIAPAAGTGCVNFKAAAVQSKQIWYKDERGLTLWLCEDGGLESTSSGPPSNEDAANVDCCACDTAKYTITLQGLWSRETHPKDFPGGHGDHWSDLIGASHTKDYTIWEYGNYASLGVQRVAEWGSPTTLEREILSQTRNIKTVIRSRGLWPARGNMSAVLSTNRTHNLVSALSMIGPSPDWCVGVSRVNLCTKDCDWLPRLVVDLTPWDAGTDSGITFRSDNAPTVPKQRIYPITSSFPSNPLSAFYDPTGRPIPPLAKLVFERTDTRQFDENGEVVCETEVVDTNLAAGGGAMPPKQGMMPPKNGVMPPKEGMMPPKEGIMPPKEGMSSSEVTMPPKEGMMPPKEGMMPPKEGMMPPKEGISPSEVTMPPKEGMMPPKEGMVPPSEGPSSPDEVISPEGSMMNKGGGHETTPMMKKPRPEEVVPTMPPKSILDPVGTEEPTMPAKKIGRHPIDCMMTPWGDWSDCSKSCGKGVMQRRRSVKVKPRHGGQVCGKQKDKKNCVSGQCPRDCKMSGWGKWTPCNVTCGSDGTQLRLREIKRQPRGTGEPCGPTVEERVCGAPIEC